MLNIKQKLNNSKKMKQNSLFLTDNNNCMMYNAWWKFTRSYRRNANL